MLQYMLTSLLYQVNINPTAKENAFNSLLITDARLCVVVSRLNLPPLSNTGTTLTTYQSFSFSPMGNDAKMFFSWEMYLIDTHNNLMVLGRVNRVWESRTKGFRLEQRAKMISKNCLWNSIPERAVEAEYLNILKSVWLMLHKEWKITEEGGNDKLRLPTYQHDFTAHRGLKLPSPASNLDDCIWYN